MESDRELLARYPGKPPKLVLSWNDARLAAARAGEAYVAAGQPRGSAESRRLCDAERWEEFAYDRVFSPGLAARGWAAYRTCRQCDETWPALQASRA